MTNNNGSNTDELLKLLFKEQSLEHLLRHTEHSMDIPSFGEYITALTAEKGMTCEQVTKRANLERSYGHKLYSGTRKPSRDTVFQLAFGLEADVDVAQKMLKYACKSALYPKVKRDMVILYCLHNRISLTDTQIILHDLKLPVLGKDSSDE